MTPTTPTTPTTPMPEPSRSTPGTRRQVARPAAGLVALLAGLGLSQTAGQTAHAAGPRDWHIARNGPAGEQLTSGLAVRLVNVTLVNDDVLAYGEREYGINLVWQSNSGQQNIRFDKFGGGTIRNGDRVALHVQNGGYVKYGEREYGINLVWSSRPVYEWEVFGGAPGAPVVMGPFTFHGLRNTAIQRPVVYGEREYGINLVWF
jgi:hypothetical protein